MSLVQVGGLVGLEGGPIGVASTILSALPFKRSGTGLHSAQPAANLAEAARQQGFESLPGAYFAQAQRAYRLAAQVHTIPAGVVGNSGRGSTVGSSSATTAIMPPVSKARSTRSAMREQPISPPSLTTTRTTSGTNMSILADFGRQLGQGIIDIGLRKISQRANVNVLPGAGAVATPPIFQPMQTSAGFLPALPAIGAAAGRAAGAAGRVLMDPRVQAAAAGAAGALLAGGNGGSPRGYHLAKDGSGRYVRNRYMNYGNARAARRAIRRIKGTRKLLQSIERQLPRQRTTRARRDLGKGHTHVR